MDDSLKTIVKEALLTPLNGPVVVSVSGGVDSMVLLHVLHTANIPIIAAHVNHKKRRASDKEYESVKSYCEQLDVPFEGRVYNESPGNFQAKARAFRLSFIKDIALKYGATTIMTAHHEDDRIETFLMRLIEGRTLAGLNPMTMATESDGFSILKPFLNVKKAMIEAYAKNHAVPHYLDASNLDTAYTRNYIRHEIIPRLKNINPSFESSTLQVMDELAEADAFLEHSVTTHPTFHKATIHIAEFLSFNSLFQRRFLKRIIQKHIPDYHPSKNELDALIKELDQSGNFSRPLKNGFSLCKEYRVFFIAKRESPVFSPLKITGPGLYSLPNGNTLEISHEKKVRNVTKDFKVWYNDDVYPLHLRTREDGDTLWFSFGHKKIKDLFIDQKIPPHKRDKILLLSDDKQNVLWIPELAIEAKQAKGMNCVYVYLHETTPPS